MRRRGTTLIELMISLAILAILLSIAVATLLALSTVIRVSNLRRATASIVRQAARTLERDLSMAGYGIEPALAFDFTIYQGAGAYYCGGGPGGDVTGNSCPGIRDRIDRPDEVVFYARNPEYWGGDLGSEPEGKAWGVTGADADSVTISAHGGEAMRRGQILQLVCSGGTASAYVRVSRTTKPGMGSVDVPIEAAVAGDPFTQSGAQFWAACGGLARAFQVDRYRYYIDPAVVLADGSTAPFLMLDHGVDRNEDGGIDVKDAIPIAPGITDLQLSYVRPEDPAGLVQVGGTSATLTAWCSNSSRPVTGPGSCPGGLRVVNFLADKGAGDYPSFSYLMVSAGAGLRKGADAANVTAVHVGVSGRSLTKAPVFETQPLLLNRSTLQPTDIKQPYVYDSAQLMVITPNLQARGLTFL